MSPPAGEEIVRARRSPAWRVPLFAHHVRDVSPEPFMVAGSFSFLVSVLVGGIGTIGGPVLGESR